MQVKTTTGQAALDAVRAFKAMGMSQPQAVAAVITAMTSAHIDIMDMVATLAEAR
jgi:hypothetical protein